MCAIILPSPKGDLFFPECTPRTSERKPKNRNMNKYIFALCAIVISNLTPLHAISEGGGINGQVIPAMAPNAFGSPSYSGWVTNAITGLETGASTVGAPGPSQYVRLNGSVQLNQFIATGFPSWLGNADPVGAYGAAYANELGNRLQFGVVITGNSQFSISNLSFSATSSDPGNYLGFSFAAGSYNYSNEYVGVQKGADGILGTGDDVFITSGSNTQLVDEIIGRGSGNVPAAVSTDPGATNQDKINGVINGLMAQGFNQDVQFTGTYSMNGTPIGSATVTIQSVPEPGTTTCALIGALGLFGLRRRRR